jgi:RNA polymerase sigma factor (sigma-70 family)
MVQRKADVAGIHLEALRGGGTLTDASDAQLLDRATGERGVMADSAFRELIERHASMVMGVCRQILRRPHDADDAFQATFLVLVRKSRAIRVPDSLGPWLYKVAYRTAQRARMTARRHQFSELEDVEGGASSDDETCAIETAPVLHEEIGRLPEKYRTPIVLCHLEGRTHEEAARALNWPVGTVSGRLSRGRALLKRKLERRGLAVSQMALARSFVDLAVPPTHSLIESTLACVTSTEASQSMTTSVLSLAEGVMKTMLWNKIKAASLAILLIASASAATGAIVLHAASQPTKPNGDGAAPTTQAQSAFEQQTAKADGLGASPSPGQDLKAPAVQQEAMKKLNFLAGQWKGESWTEFVPGQRSASQGTETLQYKLGGLLLTIEGVHRLKTQDSEGGRVVHSAFTVVSYDEKAKRYRFQAYTDRGSYTEAEAKVGDGSLEWGFRIPQFGEARYTIRLNEKGQWFEIGEVSQNGKDWRKFFEMTLDRVNER